MITLVTDFDARVAAREPVAVVSVRNLQANLGPVAAHDAWGRPGRTQPVLISAEVGLPTLFEEASRDDRVSADTVHYGSLSKAILASLGRWKDQPKAAPEAAGKEGTEAVSGTLRDVLEGIWQDLTGLRLDGTDAAPWEAADPAVRPLLNPAFVRSFTVTVHLPKASLVGDGVSLTAMSVFRTPAQGGPVGTETLRLHRLRVPTLIGVHPHERTAKQAVVADVAIDKMQWPTDSYWKLEALVVKILETSSFETLEALAAYMAKAVLNEFPPGYSPDGDWRVHVALEKPIAVPFADAPVVEVRMSKTDL